MQLIENWRRTMLLVTAICLAGGTPHLRAAEPATPNIIVILSDDK